MTEKQAWEKLANAYARKARWLQRFSAPSHCFGICFALSTLQLPNVVLGKMSAKLPFTTNLSGFVWPLEDWKSRAAFCRKQAKLLEKRKR